MLTVTLRTRTLVSLLFTSMMLIVKASLPNVKIVEENLKIRGASPDTKVPVGGKRTKHALSLSVGSSTKIWTSSPSTCKQLILEPVTPPAFVTSVGRSSRMMSL